VQGTLWIDTVSKVLRDIEFEYIENRESGAPQSGGRIEFRQMGNGIVIIDRWALRLPEQYADTTPDATGKFVVHRLYRVQEAGGEVATARWRDGFEWSASLGSLRAQVVDSVNHLAGHIVVFLQNSDYADLPDASGIVEIPHLLPGPYAVSVTDSALERLGITLPTSVAFEAKRDSVAQRSFNMPRRETLVRESCLRSASASNTEHPFALRVIDATGRPVTNTAVDLERYTETVNQSVHETLSTDEDGTIVSCLVYHGNDRFVVTVHRANQQPYSETYSYRNANLTIRLEPDRKP
jgi:hypothetical protein